MEYNWCSFLFNTHWVKVQGFSLAASSGGRLQVFLGIFHPARISCYEHGAPTTASVQLGTTEGKKRRGRLQNSCLPLGKYNSTPHVVLGNSPWLESIQQPTFFEIIFF